MSSNVSCLPERCGILVELPKYPSVVSYHAIQSFNHPCTPNMFTSVELCQTQTHIHIDSPLINDDSDDEALEIFSNLLPAFGQKIFFRVI